ncbi:MAG: hypothetical protein CMM38_06705 [Rhodospirillaceae bacterium]|nr:hypothetical protein [Rhodospirillaceae bacterium]|tara:strand:+ start:4236 stop:5393 length:1158 start_codon:yes stop_codon:yes gene_type:complete
MRKLNIIICLSFAFILGSAGSSAALPQCSAESDYWNNCFGTRTYDNEYKYVGEFKDNKKHGQGTYTWATGNKYVGEFKDNKIHGKGTFTSADGEKYVGEFKNNQIHGHGTRTYSDGRIDEGVWENNKFKYTQSVAEYRKIKLAEKKALEKKQLAEIRKREKQERDKKLAEQKKQRKLVAQAKQGNADAQFTLAVMYENGDGVPRDEKTAMKWYRLAAEQGHDDASERYSTFILEDIIYKSDVRALVNLGDSLETECKKDIKCAFIKIWTYIDITKDDHLSAAEIARFQRNIVKFAAADEGENVLETEDFAAIQLASIIFLPITASSVLNSFDYDNDGLLSKNEVFGDTEFSKLVGINIDIFSNGFEFKSLGKKLQDAMEVIPLLK